MRLTGNDLRRRRSRQRPRSRWPPTLMASRHRRSAPSCSTRPASPHSRARAGSSTARARMGWLNRMTQWKDKAGKNREGAERRPLRLSGAPGRRRARSTSATRTCRWARTRSSISSWRATSPPSSTPISSVDLLPAARAVHLEGRPAHHRACATAARRCQVRSVGRCPNQPDRTTTTSSPEAPQGPRPIPSRCPIRSTRLPNVPRRRTW